MSKKIVSSICMIALAVFLLIAAGKSMEYYECLMFHYPDNFVEVELYEDPSDYNPEPDTRRKNKAVYNRRYIFEDKIYRTDIAQKEFDDRFFVCEDMPARVYSETDLESPSKDLVLSVIMIFIAIIMFLVALCRIVIEIWRGLRS
ncbi:MAG: hypothetical protein IJO85_08215 [Lachnospiraceae bacterium]|nr:hypothetical protein [Lachnospiraceae bacterium]